MATGPLLKRTVHIFCQVSTEKCELNMIVFMIVSLKRPCIQVLLKGFIHSRQEDFANNVKADNIALGDCLPAIANTHTKLWPTIC